MNVHRLEDDEIKKILEQRKREKNEEKVAKDRVRAMIEADKAARKAKFGGSQEQPTPAPVPAKAAAPVAVQPKDYSTTRIQVSLIHSTPHYP